MAKKKAVRTDFNMSEAIRQLLTENPAQSSREIYDALSANYPDQTINRNSCNVAFSHARRKLGLQKGAVKKVVKRKPSTSASVSTSHSGLNYSVLQSAKDLLKHAGSAEAAIEAIQQLESLQLN